MTHATDNYEYHIGCGGTILTATDHYYCDRCGAYQYHDVDDDFPTGRDPVSNREAWDSGEDRSPDAFPQRIRACWHRPGINKQTEDI
jgi:hypothetical protein